MSQQLQQQQQGGGGTSQLGGSVMSRATSKAAYNAMPHGDGGGGGIVMRESRKAARSWKNTAWTMGVLNIALGAVCFIVALALVPPTNFPLLVSSELPTYVARYYNGALLAFVFAAVAGGFAVLMTWKPLFSSAFEQAFHHNAFGWHIPFALLTDAPYMWFISQLAGIHDVFNLILLAVLGPAAYALITYCHDLINDAYLTRRFEAAIRNGSLLAGDEEKMPGPNYIPLVGGILVLLTLWLQPMAYLITLMINLGLAADKNLWFYIVLFCVGVLCDLGRPILMIVRYQTNPESGGVTQQLRRLVHWAPLMIALPLFKIFATVGCFAFVAFKA